MSNRRESEALGSSQACRNTHSRQEEGLERTEQGTSTTLRSSWCKKEILLFLSSNLNPVAQPPKLLLNFMSGK